MFNDVFFLPGNSTLLAAELVYLNTMKISAPKNRDQVFKYAFTQSDGSSRMPTIRRNGKCFES